MSSASSSSESVLPRAAIPRRALLRAAGAAVALPLLDGMVPAFRLSARSRALAAAVTTPPQRLFAIHVPLGMMPQFFFPAKSAVHAATSAPPSSHYLDLLADQRGKFTIFSGMSHPDVDGNHHAGQCFLTGAPHPGHLAFDESRNKPLANLFVTMLEKLGVEADVFSSSTGPLRGLDA